MATTVGNLQAIMTMNNASFIAGMKQSEMQAKKSSASIGNSLLAVGKQTAILGASFAAMAGAFVLHKAIKEASDFEDAMADMVKVTDESSDSIVESIDKIDPALGSSTELVRGYYQTISAGVTEPTEALEFLTSASQFAKAAHIDQAEAVEVLSKMMNGYQGSLTSASDAADLLFAIEAKGIVKVKELTPIIGELAAQSNSMSVKTYEMGGALAHLTKVSGSASEAGTKYQAVLTALRKGNLHLEEAYKDLGVASGQALIQQRGFSGALEALGEYAEKSGKSIGDLFTRVEAITGSIILSSNSMKDLKKVQEEVMNSTGGLKRAFEEQQKTLTAIKETISNQVSNALRELGEEVMPDVVKALNNFSDWFADNKDEIVDTLAGVYDGFMLVGESITSTIKPAIPILAEIGGEVGTLLSTTLEGYNSLPDAVKTVGLVAAILYGPTGVGVLVGLGATVGLFEDLNKAMADASGQEYVSMTEALGRSVNTNVTNLQKLKIKLADVADDLYKSSGGLLDFRLEVDRSTVAVRDNYTVMDSFIDKYEQAGDAHVKLKSAIDSITEAQLDSIKAVWAKAEADEILARKLKDRLGLEKAAAEAEKVAKEEAKEYKEALKELTKAIDEVTEAEEKGVASFDYQGRMSEVQKYIILQKQRINNEQVALTNLLSSKKGIEEYKDSWLKTSEAIKNVDVKSLQQGLAKVSREIDAQKGLLAGLEKGWKEVTEEVLTFSDIGYAAVIESSRAVDESLGTVFRHYAYGLNNAKELLDDTLDDSVRAAEEAYSKSLEELNKSYADGVIDTEEYEERKLEIKKNFDEAKAQAHKQHNEDIAKAERQLGIDLEKIWESVLGSILDKIAKFVVDALFELGKIALFGSGGFSLSGIFGGGSSGGISLPGIGGVGLGSWLGSGGPAAGSTIIGAGGTPVMAGGVAGMNPAGAGLGGAGAGGGSLTSILSGISWSTVLAGAGIGVILGGVLNQVLGERTRPMTEMEEARMGFEVGSPEYEAITNRMREYAPMTIGGMDQDREGNMIDNRFQEMIELAGSSFDVNINYDQNFDRIMGGLEKIIDLRGGDDEIAVDIVTELVDNATIPMQQKMEALGMVGSTGGWTSDATISMIAQMIDTGIPWDTINETLETYGVADDEVIKEIVGHYTDEGMSLEDLQYMLEESGVPEHLLREIMTTVEPVTADRESFNNFIMGTTPGLFNNFQMDASDTYNDFQMDASDTYNGFEMDANEASFNNGSFAMDANEATFNRGTFAMDYDGPHSLGYHGPYSLGINYQGAATGGSIPPGGSAWVGERGPELAFFPTGAKIYSHGESLAMADGMGNQGRQAPIHVHVEVGGEEFAAYIANVSEEVRVEAERAIEAGQPRTRRIM